MEQSDLSIVSDVKEPFSLDVFIEDQILGRWKNFRRFLDERGILFFLTSPFQFRNRMITLLIGLIIMTLVGFIPRSIELAKASNARDAEQALSEIQDKIFSNGSIGIDPLSSSHHEREHVLAFLITGSAEDGVSSVADNYVVKLEPFSGVVDGEHVFYRYRLVPIDSNRRLLLLHVDMTKQNDTSGNFSLTVYQKAEEKGMYVTSMRVVLSETQKTSDLFDDSGIHLEALSKYLVQTNAKETPIKDAKALMKEKIKVYDTMVTEIESTGATVSPSVEELTSKLDAGLGLTSLTDDSKTSSVVGLDPTIPAMETIIPSITINGATYSSTGGNAIPTDENGQPLNTPQETNPDKVYADNQLPTLTRVISDATSAVSTLNTHRTSKYNQLLTLQRALSTTVDVDTFTDRVPTR